MKLFISIVSICALGLLTSIVVGQVTPSRPLEVPSADWIPIGDNFGFVVTPAASAKHPNMLTGYFVAWHDGSWRRIDSEGVVRLKQLQK